MTLISIAVSPEFALVCADKRIVEFDVGTGEVFKVLDDNYSKIFVIDSNICIVMTGSPDLFEMIQNKINKKETNKKPKKVKKIIKKILKKSFFKKKITDKFDSCIILIYKERDCFYSNVFTNNEEFSEICSYDLDPDLVRLQIIGPTNNISEELYERFDEIVEFESLNIKNHSDVLVALKRLNDITTKYDCRVGPNTECYKIE